MSEDGLRAADLRAAWRDLVERRLPQAAGSRPDWPVRLDHCFARILLDNALGRPWREAVRPPAWRNTPAGRLATALTLGEAVLAGGADLAALNRRSLALRRLGRSRPTLPEGEGRHPAGEGETLGRAPSPRSRGEGWGEGELGIGHEGWHREGLPQLGRALPGPSPSPFGLASAPMKGLRPSPRKRGEAKRTAGAGERRQEP